MESIMLAIKYLLFYGMAVIVLVLIGAVLIAALYPFVRDQVRILRRGPFVQPTVSRKSE
jgi:hypothetical protein